MPTFDGHGSTGHFDDRQRRRASDRPIELQQAVAGLERVLLVDDHRTFSDLLAYALETQDDFSVVGQAGSVAEALALADELHPTLVLMDIGLPDGDGITATRAILERHPEIRIIILTALVDGELFRRASQAGVSGFLVKSGQLSDVFAALRGARGGFMIIDSSMMSSFASSAGATRQASGGTPVLTSREQQVLLLLAEGLDVRAIAKSLRIGINTSRNHVRSLREKLGARTQLEAVSKATRMGLLTSLLRSELDGPSLASLTSVDEQRRNG
jgi:DNA-binding NarL/FixJ family response regulator